MSEVGFQFDARHLTPGWAAGFQLRQKEPIMLGRNYSERTPEHCQHVSYRRGEGLAKTVPCTKEHNHDGPHSFQEDER
ncbi:hypothetical protein SEA_SHAGRAT_67 [Rhodococcus phage Shagrat]|nr:hypothetical protein SEA_SHAGRAT_67 [Rhodococcus phage Shagrat]